jgi:hypothetical protein
MNDWSRGKRKMLQDENKANERGANGNNGGYRERIRLIHSPTLLVLLI